jgi:hypothetical protein
MAVIPTRVPLHHPRRPSVRRLAAALLGAIVAFSLGCGYWGSARIPAYAYQGEIQIVNSPQAQHWLRTEYQRVPHLRRAVNDHGLPAYLLMVDRYVVHMIYPERDKVVSVNIETGWIFDIYPLPDPDRVVVHFETPPVLLAFLPRDTQLEIRARRHEQETRWPSAAPLAE